LTENSEGKPTDTRSKLGRTFVETFTCIFMTLIFEQRLPDGDIFRSAGDCLCVRACVCVWEVLFRATVCESAYMCSCVCQPSPTASCGWAVLRHCGSCSLYLILTVRLPGTCRVSVCVRVCTYKCVLIPINVCVLETVPRAPMSYLHLCFCLV